MEIRDCVLQILRESPEAVSGETMAQRLGISRSGVWKAVRKLREEGYGIEAATNKGYRLTSESGVFSPENIRRLLASDMEGIEIDLREEVSSTNTVLKELAEQGRQEGLVLIAENQVRGKGRLGRSFYSPRGSGDRKSTRLNSSHR